MKIEIINWEKYNYRKDINNPSWFRLNNDFWLDQQFFPYDSDVKFIWIALLCIASKNQSNCAYVDVTFMSRVCNVPESKIKRVLDILSNEIKCVRIRNVDVTDTCATEQTIQNKHNKTYLLSKSETQKFKIQKSKLEELYTIYPRKEGKKIGFARLHKIIDTEEKFQQVKKAIENYASLVEDRDKKYIKIFSSFVSVWEDYLEIDKSNLSKWSLKNLKGEEKDEQS